ncbi:PIN domain-containing protein [bacterium]|nr:MAG: PIN domain-containing protein [bacterium]
MAVDTSHRVVIDASAILSYILPDESTPKNVLSVFRKYAKDEVILFAPTLLSYEIGSAIKSAVKQKRLNELTATGIIDDFKQIEIMLFDPNISSTLALSLKHNLSFYDASYLCLAQEQNAKLFTLDEKLKKCKI